MPINRICAEYACNAPSLVLIDRHWVLRLLDFLQKGLRGVKKIVCLPSLLSSSSGSESCSEDSWRWKNNLYGIQTLSAIVFPPVCPWSARMYNQDFWNCRNAGTSSCCFLHKCVEANPSPRMSRASWLFQMLSAILDPSYSNELLRQFLVHLDHNGVPISNQRRDSDFKRISTEGLTGRNILPLPSLIGMISFVCFTGFVRILNCLVRVSSVQDCSNSVEQDPSSFAIDRSVSNSVLMRLCLGFRKCNSSTNRFLPRHITTQNVRSGSVGDWIGISSLWLPSSCTRWTSMTGPIMVLPGIAACGLHFGSDRGCVYSRHAVVKSPKSSFTSGMVL